MGFRKTDLKDISFVKGKNKHKYTAILPDGKKVNFGHKDYEHYKDRVPIEKGGGLYSSLDHNDNKRRKLYRTRHTRLNKNGILTKDIKYSPEWFSYYLLW